MAATCVAFGHSFALSEKDVDAVTLTITGGAAPTYRVRFFTGYSGSAWSTYTDVNVTSGGTVSTSIPSPTLSGYSFKGWVESAPSGSNYSSPIASNAVASATVTADKTYYPIFESTADYAYTNSTYYEANVDVAINASSIGSTRLGKRYLGIDGIPNATATWDESRNLLTSSGVYRFSNVTGGAVIERKIGFKPNSDWMNNWGSGCPTFYAYQWDGNGNKSTWLGNNPDANGKFYAYVPYYYSNLIITRSDHDTASFSWNNINQSGDLWIPDDFGGTHYSSTTPVLTMSSTATKDSYSGWNKDSSTWAA